jgi:acetylornithine deacetylase
MMIDEKALEKTLQELVSIESVNPSLDAEGHGERDICLYLEKTLKGIGIEAEILGFGENRGSVVGVIKGSGGGKSLMLNGHIDTVSVANMDIDPVKPEMKEGKLYGRGSEDMKGGVAAIIAAARGLLAAKIPLKGDVILALVGDEEYKSKGTEMVLEKYTTDAAIVTEPTALTIALAHKGFVWSQIEVFGKAAHGSRPEEGIDAIMKGGKILAELDRFQEEILKKRHHPLVGHPSVHASIINGGREISTYPEYCKIELERRTIPGEDELALHHELTKIIDTLSKADSQLNANTKVLFSRPPMETPAEEEMVQTLAKSYKDVTGDEPNLGGASFWTDAALIAAKGIPTVNFGPKGNGLHGATEYVELESVKQNAAVILDFILNFCC